ncbi:MAG: hypothetical protein ACI81R_000754 [Bradymonadia bacterium]|jgi:hypothetical protein
MIRKKLWLPVLLATTLASLVGCGPETPVSYDLVLVTDRSSIAADGSEQAEITVSLLDNRGNPPELGSTVVVLLQAPGRVTGFPGQQGTTLTDSTGLATFDIECDGNLGEFFVTAAFEGGQGVLPARITCTEPPNGLWQIRSQGVSPDPLIPEEPAEVTFLALTDTGVAVPDGTRMVVSINSGNISFTRGSDTVSTRTDAAGMFSVAFSYPDESTSSQICANFENQGFGEQGCAVINPQGAECRGSFSPIAIPADGVAIARVSYNVITAAGQPARDVEVSVTVANAMLVDDLDGNNGTLTKVGRTDNNGQVGFFVQSATTAGSPAVTATTAFDDNGVAQALTCVNNSGLVFEPTPECYFQPITPISFEGSAGDILGIAGSPFPTRAAVVACFRDLDGDPVSAGQLVTFNLRSEAVGYALVPEQAPTDSSGCASTQLRTGSVPDSISVRAELGRPEFQTSCTSESIVALSGRPVTAGWTVDCEPDNVGGMLSTDSENVTLQCESPCSMILRDVRGNPVSSELFPISFVSEQGVVSVPNGQTSEDGDLVFSHEVNGVLPYRFGPQGNGEVCGFDPVGTDSLPCPSDGIVSILSYVDGEEWFLDRNANGVWDTGEPFEDLGEPYLDLGEDGVFTPNVDVFIDTAPRGGSLNGVYDGPNQQWDAETKIWRTTFRLITGPVDAQNSTVVGRGPLSALNGLSVQDGGTDTVEVLFRDEYNNPIASGASATVSLDGNCTDANVEVSLESGRLSVDDLNFEATESRTYYGGGGVIPSDGTVNVRDPRVVRFERTLRPEYTTRSLARAPGVRLIISRAEDGSGRCTGSITVAQSAAAGECSSAGVLATSFPFAIQ